MLAALPSGGGAVSPQATALPSGAATQLGMGESFTMQLSTGTAGYSVPLSLPSARGTVQPRLDLSYTAAGGFGVAGVGWSIGTPAISRQTDRGTPLYDDRSQWHPEQDRFVFGGMELVPICTVSGSSCAGALAGELMPAWASGWQYFRARVEGGFLRFFWSPDRRTWRVQAKDGTNMEFGVPLDGTGYAAALQSNPSAPAEIFRWYLVREYDSQGGANAAGGPVPVNVIFYRYLSDGNTPYLTDIFDTPPADNPTTTNLALYAHHTSLHYEARPDPAISYRSGFLTEHLLRVSRVDVTSKPFTGGTGQERELVRRYHLGYDGAAHRSLLTRVQAEGRCSSPVLENGAQVLPLTSCPRLPAITFGYEHVSADVEPLVDAQGYAFEGFDTTVRTLANSPPYSLDERRTGLADINADGLPDVLVTAPGFFQGRHGVYFNGHTATGTPGFGNASRMAVQAAADVVDAEVLSLASPVVAALDLDADGIVNLVHMPQARRYSVFSPQPTSSGASTFRWVGRDVLTASGQDVKVDFTRNAINTRVMDVNGDGLVDIVYSSATELQTFFALGRYPGGHDQFGQARWTSASSADIRNEPAVHCIPWSSTPVRLSDRDTHVADMNGDGLLDIVRVRSGQMLYWPGRGNGFWGTGDRDDCEGGGFVESRHVTMSNAPRFGTSQPGTLLLNDVNGDGLSDMVEVRNQGVDIYLNDGGFGWTERRILSNTPFRPSDSNYVRLTDIDGSGTPDILWGRAREYQYIDLTGGKTPHLLVRVSNGLGKTVELEYASSTDLMLQAAAAGQPWASMAPITMPVLVRTTVRDHLEAIGRPAGVYVNEFSYRDPVFEGRQREFRGFRSVTATAVGDGNSPTSHHRTFFELGECAPDLASTAELCSPAGRWQDNWREGLKGLPIVSETFDDQGVYQSTAHTTYRLRQLYTGLDGRRVSMVVPVAQDSYLYDTDGFVPAVHSEVLPGILVDLTDSSSAESHEVSVRASSGTAHLRSETVYDDFGNTVDSIRHGCVEGCPNGVDEAITTHSDFALPAGDDSGWLWREVRSYVVGSVETSRRAEQVRTYNARGDLEESYAVLSGTLLLDRFHATGQATAPAPPEQSGGTTGAIQILVADHSYDAFGHPTFTRGPNAGCSSAEFDPDYAHLPVTARVYGGPLNSSTNCGSRVFTHQVTYDRGLEAVVTSVDTTGQPLRFDYDGMGRLVATFAADPDLPGQLAVYPAMTASYTLPEDAAVTPYTLTVVRTQDGSDPNVDSYSETWTYGDALGRTIAALSQADPSAGDGGDWIVAGDVLHDAKGQVARAYEPWFYSGAAAGYPLGTVPATAYKSLEYDAFGRTTRAYGLDRQIEALISHHALSTDTYDAGDILPTPHQNTYLTSVSDGHGRTVRQIERTQVGGQIELRYSLNEYLPTGEIFRATQHRPGSPDVVRWLRYDSLGRMVLNVEPNTSSPFNADPSTAPSTLKAYRYAYNDAGDLVGYSDARGCGANYHYDTSGRVVAEDRSPCLAHHAGYTAPNLSTGDGTEAFYRYDTGDPDASTIIDASGATLNVDTAPLWGRLASASGLAAKAVYRYDARGRSTGVAVRLQKPGTASVTLSSRYAARWYLRVQVLDARGRVKTATTGATLPELRGLDGTSELRLTYSKRGAVRQIGSSYGTLFAGEVRLADGSVESFKLGDASGVERYFTYDEKRRIEAVQTYRGNVPLWSNPPPGSSYTPPTPLEDPTQQLLLEDSSIIYDAAGDVRAVEDYRIDDEWPSTAKPVTRSFEYDDLRRLTRVTYSYPGSGTDTWSSPYAHENVDPAIVQPSPHVSFANRPTEQQFAYDWLGNIAQSTDDQQAFWDRSTGTRSHGVAASGPHRILSASNRTLAPSSPRKGDLSVDYDAAGNVTGLIVRRDGACLPAGTSCWQRFDYEWNEIGELTRARRWDLNASERTSYGQFTQSPPARAPDAELRYHYDASGARRLKTAVDQAGIERHTLYVFGSLELRSAIWNAGGVDYTLDPEKVSVRLSAGPATARVVHSPSGMPSVSGSGQHLFLALSDYLGSTSFLIDHATGELVEHSTYQAYGAAETDYRPGRWQGFREPYKFTGKEEDIEVGLAYFGARYYSPYLNLWISPDPVTIHELGSDPNPYAYVHGMPTMAVDPDGRFGLLAALVIGAIVGAVVAAAANAISASANGGQVTFWGPNGWGMAMAVGAVAGLAGGAAGGAVGGAIGGAWGGVAGGVVGGATGAAAGYGTGAALGTHEFSWSGFGTSVGLGAVSGGIGGGVGAAIGPSIGGPIAGGTAGGLTNYVGSGLITGDWSAQSFALSVGVGVAGAVAAYGAGRAAEAASSSKSPSVEVAKAQKAPAGDGLKQALGAVDDALAALDRAAVAPAPQARQPGLEQRYTISEDSSGFTVGKVGQGNNFSVVGDVQEGTPGKVTLDKFSLGSRGAAANVHMGRQGKHMPGHPNFRPGRSVLRADPGTLAARAGTGEQVGRAPVGQPGSKERVTFDYIIGDYVEPTTGATFPTQVGIIHYSKDGVHIVPGRPK